MSLLLVPAITIGLSLLGYQTYVWVAGETFNGFSFDIGRLWSTDVKSEENFDQIEKDIANGKLKIVYAGLLGIAQGVYKLCQELDYSNVQLHIYGAGAEQKKIENLIDRNASLDIVYHGEVSREEIHKELTKYDITIIPLLNRIYGSVPSKIFEYARLGMPMMYFGGGEGENIIKKHALGWIAEPSNYKSLNRIISKIDTTKLESENRIAIQKEALSNFDFNNQLNQLITLI